MAYTKLIPFDAHNGQLSNIVPSPYSAGNDKTPVFNNRHNIIRELMQVSECFYFEKGEVVLSSADQNKFCYDVIEGVTALSKISACNNRQIIDFTFGPDLVPLFEQSDGYGMRALTSVRLVKYRLSELNKTLSHSAELGSIFRRYTNNILASQMRHIQVIGQCSALQRVAYFLLKIYDHQSKHDQTSLRLTHPITRLNVSNYLGITIETTSRSFSKLRRDGIIDFNNSHETKIQKLEALMGVLR